MSRIGPERTLIAILLLAGAAWLTTDLLAQDVQKEAPPKKARKEAEDDDTKPAAPKPQEKKTDTGSKAKEPGKKRNEEEEDNTKQPAAKVPTVEEDNTPAKQLPARLSAAGLDLGTAAKQAKNRRVKNLFKSLAIQYDRVSFSTREERVAPIADYVADNPQAYWKRGGTTIQPLDADGRPTGKAYNPMHSSLYAVRHYEQLAMDAVDEFLRQSAKDTGPDSLPRSEQLAAAEAVFAAVIRFHDGAIQTGRRKGDDWKDAVYKPLKSRLLDIQLEQLRTMANAGHWETAFNLAVALVKDHPGENEQQRIAKPLIDLLNASFNKGISSGEGTRLAFRRLRELEDQLSDKSLLTPISKGLQAHADRLYALAKEQETKNPDKALEAISQAVELAPSRAELRAFQRKLMQSHRILRVGVRELPEFLSPAMATTDSELRALELLYDSLVKLRIDATGDARYVPGLAEGRPRVESLTRNFYLPHDQRWSNEQDLTANDIRATVDRAKQDHGTRLPNYWSPLLNGVIVGGDPYRVKLELTQGYFEPLSLTSFKILPADAAVDTEEFARHPISSGPYRLDEKVDAEGGRRCKSFFVNQLYGKRQGKLGLPRIQEIRFFTYNAYDPKLDNATDEFDRMATQAPLDILLDLTSEHATAIAKRAGASGVRVLRPVDNHWPNRRIYFLAINSKHPDLSDQNVRIALAHAIDREKLLNDHFRPKAPSGMAPILGPMHAALNGPYPAGSWACDSKVGVPKKKGSLDLFDPDAARTKYKDVKKRPTPFQLKYPSNEPNVRGAMEALCKQLSDVLDFPAEAVPVDVRQLRTDVEIGDYEIAYYHYDFPDETYPLWPLLDPRGPAANGVNIFGSQLSDELAGLFQSVRTHRDFAAIRENTHKIHDKVYETMPFIPLWQLDPLIAVHRSVKAPPFDPILIFNEIENWSADAR